MQIYSEDLDEPLINTQLQLVHTHFHNNCSRPPSFMDIVDFVRPIQQLLSEVVKLVILILVAPATNASSERSFSALRIIKTYLRTTMAQSRLNHLMLLHVHKEQCDRLDLDQCANDFCSKSEHRMNIFGTF